MLDFVNGLSQRKAVTTLRFLYPIWAVIGYFSIMYVPARIIEFGNARTTANNIIANETLFRLGIVGSLITQLIHIAAVLVLYALFKSVNKGQASLMVILGLVGVPIAMIATLNRLAALLLLNGADYLKAFSADQLHAQVMLFLDLDKQGVLIATIFWGLWLFPLGYLVYKSAFFPRILGVILMVAGSGYLLDSFSHFLLPSSVNIEALLLPVINVMIFGEVLFMAWVLLKGAKITK